MNGWPALAVAVVTALLTGGAAVAGINALATRRTRKADVTDRMNDSALRWVEQFQEEARAARAEAAEARAEVAASRRETAEARREVDAMRREVAQVRDDAEQLGRELRSIRSLILSPAATLEALRAAVNGPGQTNGR